MRSFNIIKTRPAVPCWAFILLSWVSFSYAATEDKLPESRLPLEELRLFTQVFDHIRKAYVEDVDDKTMLENAISGLLEGLDPHSVYLNEETFRSLQESTRGEFGGIGVEVAMENGIVKVIAPIDGSPAKEAGIMSGDLILKINDQVVKGLSQAEAVELMRGPRGSMVSLLIVRSGLDEPLELELARDIIKTRSVRSMVLEPGYGYIRISQFQIDTGSQFRSEVIRMMGSQKPLKGLILDLRNNPGGLLPAAIDVADTMLDGGLVTYTEGRLPNSNTQYEATAGDLIENVPVVVMIDGGSASASEIVAGALQDRKRAVVLGTQSFGKGSVQTVLPISEDRGIKLTTARYFTPAGRSIQADGVHPDIVVKRAEIKVIEGTRYIKEANLGGHLSSGQPAPKRVSSVRAKLDLTTDNQLFEGLNVLKGAYILTKRESK